jgi:hypothetical protein
MLQQQMVEVFGWRSMVEVDWVLEVGGCSWMKELAVENLHDKAQCCVPVVLGLLDLTLVVDWRRGAGDWKKVQVG